MYMIFVSVPHNAPVKIDQIWTKWLIGLKICWSAYDENILFLSRMYIPSKLSFVEENVSLCFRPVRTFAIIK